MTWLQRHPLIYPMFRHPRRPFGTPPPFSQKMGEAGRGLGVSAPFARGNLHLVILSFRHCEPTGSNLYISRGLLRFARSDGCDKTQPLVLQYSIVNLRAILLAAIDRVKEKLEKIPRQCRVRPGFGPAFAGGLQSGNAALAQAYRVISTKIRTRCLDVGPKRDSHITNTAGCCFYTTNSKGRGEKN